MTTMVARVGRTPALSAAAKLRLAPGRVGEDLLGRFLATMTTQERRAFYLGAMLVDQAIELGAAVDVWDHHRGIAELEAAEADHRAELARRAEAELAERRRRQAAARADQAPAPSPRPSPKAAPRDRLVERVCGTCGDVFTYTRRPGRPPARCEPCRTGRRAQVA